MIVKRSLLRYHGGKWLLAPWIISLMPAHAVYTEAFGGGGSVLLRKTRAAREYYNDLNGEIYNVFRVARDRGEELRAKLELTPCSHRELVLAHEYIEDSLEQARRTIVRLWFGFKTSAQHRPEHTTGFRGITSSHDSGGEWRGFIKSLPIITQRLQGVVLENRDAIEFQELADAEGVVHYVDPPYPEETRTAYGAYAFELDDEYHLRLAQCLRGLKGVVMLSGYSCPMYEELYADWKRFERHTVNDAANARIEVLWRSKRVSAGGLFW